MRYSIIKNRGVLKEGAPLILDEGRPLVFDFVGLPDGEKWLRLAKQKDGALDKTITVKIEGPHVEIDEHSLRVGTYCVEILVGDGKNVTGKIVCTPVCVSTLATMAKGLVVYPEIDAVVQRVAELEGEVAEINAWKEAVAPLIHQHKVIL